METMETVVRDQFTTREMPSERIEQMNHSGICEEEEIVIMLGSEERGQEDEELDQSRSSATLPSRRQ